MSVIGLVVPPLTGHVNPLVSVAHELGQRGHRVVWIAHEKAVGHLLPQDSEILGLPEDFPEKLGRELAERAQQTRGLEAFRFLWDAFLIPLARGMMEPVEEAVKALNPDVLVVDQQAIAGALVARKRGIPWVTSSTTSASLIDPFALVPKVQDWMLNQLRELQIEMGVESVDRPDFSPHKMLVFSTPEFMGDVSQLPPQVRFVGPSITSRQSHHDFPFERIEGKGAILVSVGTLNQERSVRFFQAVVDGLASMERPVVVIAPPELLPQWPEHFIVARRIPQLQVLPHCSAVISHGGHNTVVETLHQGLPLVVAPIRDDQPVVAGQVVDAGAGLRVHYGRVKGPALRKALEEVLENPSFKESALRIRRSFLQSGGPVKAAEEVELC